MSLGERNTNNQNQKFSSPAIASDFSFANSKAEMEKTLLTFGFWKGFLKISIAPFKEEDANGNATYDRDNAISAYIKPAKAQILLNELRQFRKDFAAGNPLNNYGINSGNALVSISTGKEFGYDKPCLVIRKINQENGYTEASTAYTFRDDFHFAVRNYSEEAHSFTSEYDSYKGLELDMIETLLEEYIKAGTSAQAASYLTKSAWDRYCANSNIEAIAAKLGVDFASRNKGTKYSNNSFFNSNGAKSTSTPKEYESSTIDDIAGLAD